MYDILLQGFPGRTTRGWLGWSTVVLLRTPDGPVLFDTGAQGDRPALLTALAARGLTPADVGTVVLSHLHFDHVANLECFPGATVIVHAAEMAHLRDHAAADPALPLDLIAGFLARTTPRTPEGEPELWPGVRMILTPGHTTGHCSLVLGEGEGTVVLAQDAIKNRAEVPGGPPSAFDLPAARGSVARILAMATRIVPGHDVPLVIENGVVLPQGAPAETVTLTTDGREFRLEA